jgi:hypothetical protein
MAKLHYYRHQTQSAVQESVQILRSHPDDTRPQLMIQMNAFRLLGTIDVGCLLFCLFALVILTHSLVASIIALAAVAASVIWSVYEFIRSRHYLGLVFSTTFRHNKRASIVTAVMAATLAFGVAALMNADSMPSRSFSFAVMGIICGLAGFFSCRKMIPKRMSGYSRWHSPHMQKIYVVIVILYALAMLVFSVVGSSLGNQSSSPGLAVDQSWQPPAYTPHPELPPVDTSMDELNDIIFNAYLTVATQPNTITSEQRQALGEKFDGVTDAQQSEILERLSDSSKLTYEQVEDLMGKTVE